MNWYKKAQPVLKKLDWDRIARELRRELGREPHPSEVQQRLYDKYWEMTDQPQGEQLMLFQSQSMAEIKKAHNSIADMKEHLDKVLGLGKYKPAPMTEEEKAEQKRNRVPREPQHSMDMGEYVGDDDGW